MNSRLKFTRMSCVALLCAVALFLGVEEREEGPRGERGQLPAAPMLGQHSAEIRAEIAAESSR